MTTATEPVIQIRELTKDFRVGFMTRGNEEHRAGFFKRKTVRALDCLSLDVNRGEVFGFLGPNGAGKTTTLKLLMGLVYPTSGSAQILGSTVEDLRTRSRIGYLPENPYFYDYLTGRELLHYTASLFGIPSKIAKVRVDDQLHTVGLDGEPAGRQLRKYSKGMLQRIGIAQALINDPEVVFMDEPMSGLDPIGRREVRDILLSLRERGKTVFFSSHILTDVEAMCDRAAILNGGRLLRCGTIDELTGAAHASIEVVAVKTDNAVLSDSIRSRALDISMNSTPSGATLVVKDESLVDEALRLIRLAGGQLVSVTPRRTSLEEVFFKKAPENPE
ncbi:MAG TPA: ABC transporter ATP-binding protein [Blastocatellia bacterium]|nr:ABC transporter ATP-binding protein [Blastocatellia bacterium]